MTNKITEIKMLEDDLTLIQEAPMAAFARIIHQYSWILTVLMVLFVAAGIYRCIKASKQDSDEKDIKNMFNEDGTKNQHYTHKDFDPIPCFVIAILFFFVRLLLIA